MKTRPKDSAGVPRLPLSFKSMGLCEFRHTCFVFVCVGVFVRTAQQSEVTTTKKNPQCPFLPHLNYLSAFCSEHHLLSLHTRIHTHSQLIRGQKRVTFAYLVSRVTRKKLSSGASIQLGRLLRIITPPRVFPLLLLRPLCCKKTINVILLQTAVMQLYRIC